MFRIPKRRRISLSCTDTGGVHVTDPFGAPLHGHHVHQLGVGGGQAERAAPTALAVRAAGTSQRHQLGGPDDQPSAPSAMTFAMS